MSFDFPLIWNSLPDLLGHGLVLTIQLTVLSVLAGLCLAVPLGILRASRNPWISKPIYVYTYIFRGTPLLIQLFLIYYGFGQFRWIKGTFLWDFLREGFWCCLIAFTLNTAAYTTEILRGAIQNVSHGEVEAARAIGMSRFTVLRRIILPQAFRIMLPAYSNEVVLMLQATSIASLVTLLELTGVARVIIARTFAPYELFITIALIYLALTYGIIWLFKKWEQHLMRHLGERPADAPEEGALVTR
jgi:His/Glu/Gln/Arg/opine family amino acid ABC transporter permease subunit